MKQLLVFALLGVSMVMAATKEVTIINKILSNIIICQLDSDLIHVDILNRMTMTITQVELMGDILQGRARLRPHPRQHRPQQPAWQHH